MKWRGPYGGGAASGAVGSGVASRAKNTQYIRARTVPVNPRTVLQVAIRNVMKTLATDWSASLTADQRAGWNDYALNVTVTNALGDPSHLSAVNWFVGNNSPRLQAGLEPVFDAPVIFDRGNDGIVAAIGDITIATDGTRGTLALTSAIAGCNGTNGALLGWISRAYGPGITYFNGPYNLTLAIPSVAGEIPAGNHTFDSAFTASGVASSDSGNQMQLVIRLDRGDGRLSSKFPFQVEGV